ncbi:GNAT family N-acetyltransferase [Streptomyces sp. NBC_01387]|uniref:GNAT family N-acetyltransferase n=1 Tax=unclassified Streptomyces TaxID=2593676 RepID=UPI00225AA058|nr:MULTISPECIES: GNAT family N-acetyltransferase [unclassified Streptomyces]MCX4551850.1 GNAT family N-acetyltransferase [Streptomyces sp. NBC_01500]WSC23214.1 GNAT family N-acetyltransferase [Streptomyces sp. NBC_01766]
MIRIAGPEDIDTIATFHAAARATYYEGHLPVAEYAGPDVLSQVREGWVRAVARQDGGVLCAEDGGVVSGVAAFRVIDGAMTLTQFHVAPARWGKGIGSALHTAVVTAWQQTGVPGARLSVFEHNLRAQRFYTRHGWQQDTTVLRGPGDDHITMLLTVPAAGSAGECAGTPPR